MSLTSTKRTALVLSLGLVLVLSTGVGVASAAPVGNVTAPSVVGTPRVAAAVQADPGEWNPADAALTYQWLLDGAAIDGATAAAYTPGRRTLGHELAVQVTASADGFDDAAATSAPVVVAKGILDNTRRPRIKGQRRYDHTLTAGPGAWSKRPTAVHYRWLRGRKAIKGATGRRHTLGLADFGRRISVEVTVRRPGFKRATAVSKRTVRIGHRVPVRHTVTYHVETRGHVVADVGSFAVLAQQTYADPRGWRGSGIRFRRVSSGGDFTLVLAEAAQVAAFSSSCSAEWSCRVGRYVVINQTRWLHASPMWNQQHLALRAYRHMVVNHETGHWLGHHHRTCPGAGALAPVMQQQSKGLNGCRPNPWPTAAERRTPRFG